jgi:hypothetical protein
MSADAAKALKAEGWYSKGTTVYYIEYRIEETAREGGTVKRRSSSPVGTQSLRLTPRFL